MGYLSGWFTKDQVVDHLTKNDANYTLLKSSLRGNVLYTAWQLSDKTRCIQVNLLSKHDNVWGYKSISDCSFPFYYDCPLSLIKLVENENSPAKSKEWYDTVRKYHARKKENKNLQIGDRFRLTYNDNVIYTCHGKIKGYLIGAIGQGTKYKFRYKDIKKYENI